jgi:superfamily II DNA or RNA helicase
MTVRRSFSDSERAALYVAAGGKCCKCGCDLQPGWHADHVHPFWAGGPTDVINGQALCPSCNLSKGGEIPVELRKWQRQALYEYRTDRKTNWTLCATPGAGKTTFASALSLELLRERAIERVTVVVPTVSLKEQWADAAYRLGLKLQPVDNGQGGHEGSDFHGAVVTYQQVTSAPHLFRMNTYATPTLVIFDEIHHAGESRDWGDNLKQAFEHAIRRLLLTGTPWRSDNNPIPWARYDHNGRVEVDFQYGYGDAVRDSVCRPISFHAYDGTARWVQMGQIVEVELNDDLPDELASGVLKSFYDPNLAWIPAIMRRADDELSELRETVPDAGGLVIADDVYKARAYAKLLQEISGERPAVVVSEDPQARRVLDEFRAGSSRWLIAIRMVSEGVDIPRLAVGVYASHTKTPLFFRQVVGRFVRQQPNDEHGASLFIPALPAFKAHAEEIEQELRHAIEEMREEHDREERGEDDPIPWDYWPLFGREPIGADGAQLQETIYRGNIVTAEERARAEAFCRESGIPLNFSDRVAVGLRREGLVRPAAEVPPRVSEPTPPYVLQRQLAQQVDQKAKQLANRQAIAAGADRASGPDYARVNNEVNNRLKVPKNRRPSAGVPALLDTLAWLDERMRHESGT